jgi:sulfur carrier protein ThiS
MDGRDATDAPGDGAVVIEVVRAGRSATHRIPFPAGGRVRDAVRAVGLAPEGAVVLVDDRPVPMDEPIPRGGRLLVVPTFSGG